MENSDFITRISIITWREAKSDPPPLESDILFKNRVATYAGTYTYISRGNEHRGLPSFIDHKKKKVRWNVHSWAFVP